MRFEEQWQQGLISAEEIVWKEMFVEPYGEELEITSASFPKIKYLTDDQLPFELTDDVTYTEYYRSRGYEIIDAKDDGYLFSKEIALTKYIIGRWYSLKDDDIFEKIYPFIKLRGLADHERTMNVIANRISKLAMQEYGMAFEQQAGRVPSFGQMLYVDESRNLAAQRVGLVQRIVEDDKLLIEFIRKECERQGEISGKITGKLLKKVMQTQDIHVYEKFLYNLRDHLNTHLV